MRCRFVNVSPSSPTHALFAQFHVIGKCSLPVQDSLHSNSHACLGLVDSGARTSLVQCKCPCYGMLNGPSPCVFLGVCRVFLLLPLLGCHFSQTTARVSWFAVSVITWNCTSPRLNRSAAIIDTFPENLGLLVPGNQIFVVEVE